MSLQVMEAALTLAQWRYEDWCRWEMVVVDILRNLEWQQLALRRSCLMNPSLCWRSLYRAADTHPAAETHTSRGPQADIGHATAYAEAGQQWFHDGLQRFVANIIWTSGGAKFMRAPGVDASALPDATLNDVATAFATSGKSCTTRQHLDRWRRYGTLVHYRARTFCISFDRSCKTRALVWLCVHTCTFHVFKVCYDHAEYDAQIDMLTEGMFRVWNAHGILPISG